MYVCVSERERAAYVCVHTCECARVIVSERKREGRERERGEGRWRE